MVAAFDLHFDEAAQTGASASAMGFSDVGSDDLRCWPHFDARSEQFEVEPAPGDEFARFQVRDRC
jgi:hypothetical protein